MVIISSYSDQWISAVFVQSQKFITPSFMKVPEPGQCTRNNFIIRFINCFLHSVYINERINYHLLWDNQLCITSELSIHIMITHNLLLHYDPCCYMLNTCLFLTIQQSFGISNTCLFLTIQQSLGCQIHVYFLLSSRVSGYPIHVYFVQSSRVWDVKYMSISYYPAEFRMSNTGTCIFLTMKQSLGCQILVIFFTVKQSLGC